ncbi:TspO/MBR family protein [Paracraurococcus ruber]|uniref:Sensory protein TspO n=1 Tax=Paracraurococcus ruber TaxID=77675 RepID=A0ABS1D386_9PROT|nr:TspO/MBR family protein [Paracraurococcus ruber]MBK1661259.1 sensory protein TspO [Paracraurococcus ruber]TDG27257.1 tryptophan-rich sensory protein [Paracraurococcus ruber]
MDITLTLGLLGFLAACFAAASTGAVFKPGAWYEALAKPRWNPPNWLFPIAWSALYVMMAFAGWLVWRGAGFAGAGLALGLWALQLALNAAWSWIFFGMKRMDWALAELVALWLALAATILAFAPHSAIAAWLLVPYLVWVSFAGFLNWTIWRLNPGNVPAAAARTAAARG